MRGVDSLNGRLGDGEGVAQVSEHRYELFLVLACVKSVSVSVSVSVQTRRRRRNVCRSTNR
jgi:hypothetical protein